MNFYLSNDHYRLPFPFATFAAAERHNAALGGRYTVVAAAERVMGEAEYEAADYMLSVEDEIERENNKYGVSDDER